MLVPFLFLLIFAVTYGLNEYYDLASNLMVACMMGVPCLFLAVISFLWPRWGGTAAASLALLLMVLSVSGILMSKIPPPGQEYPVFSLAEVVTYMLPYTVLFCGSIFALIGAFTKNFKGPDWLMGLRFGGVQTARSLSLIVLFSLIVACVIFFVVTIGISGDSIWAVNLLSGFMLGLTYAAPLLLLFIIVAWRWPRQRIMTGGTDTGEKQASAV